MPHNQNMKNVILPPGAFLDMAKLLFNPEIKGRKNNLNIVEGEFDNLPPDPFLQGIEMLVRGITSRGNPTQRVISAVVPTVLDQILGGNKTRKGSENV